LLAGRAALPKNGIAGPGYRMGFHFTPYRSESSGTLHHLPSMWGSGESEVILYPNGLVSIRIGKAGGLPPGTRAFTSDGPQTIQAVERLKALE
jgi:hypothetical protein